MQLSKLFDPVLGISTLYISALKESSPHSGKLVLSLSIIMGCYLEWVLSSMNWSDPANISAITIFLLLISFIIFTYLMSQTLSFYMPVKMYVHPADELEWLPETLQKDINWFNQTTNTIPCVVKIVHLPKFWNILNIYRLNVLASFAYDKDQNIDSGFIILPIVDKRITCPLTNVLKTKIGFQNSLIFVLSHEFGHLCELRGRKFKQVFENELHGEIFADLWALFSLKEHVSINDMIFILKDYRTADFSGPDHATFDNLQAISKLPDFEKLEMDWTKLSVLDKKDKLHNLINIVIENDNKLKMD